MVPNLLFSKILDQQWRMISKPAMVCDLRPIIKIKILKFNKNYHIKYLPPVLPQALCNHNFDNDPSLRTTRLPVPAKNIFVQFLYTSIFCPQFLPFPHHMTLHPLCRGVLLHAAWYFTSSSHSLFLADKYLSNNNQRQM